MTRSERRKHNNTYIGTEVRCRNAGNPGRRCKIRRKVKSGVARRSLLWGAAHLPVSARVRGWLTSSHDSFPIPYLGCCTFHYFPCTVFTPNFFLLETPFTKCCTFLSQLPIHVHSGNFNPRQYLGGLGTTNKQICTSQSSRAFAGMLNVKWRRANLLSEAWPHMSQDDLVAAVQSWGERWH